MRHAIGLKIGPVAFRVGSDWAAPIAALQSLYRDYPAPVGVPDYTVRLEAERPWRRWVRPSVAVRGDYILPEALPLDLAHGVLAAEIGMNLQLALGERRWLLLHASSVERDGRALIMSGESGSGKSTLAAVLATRGWRLMGDEFALIDLATGAARAFPRATSLKNAAIDEMLRHAPEARFGAELTGTPKGRLRHLRPDATAIARMDEPAMPALILFPQYGGAEAAEGMGSAEAFVRLTQASTNYGPLGRAGYDTLTRLVTTVPTVAVDYPDTATAVALVEQLWDAL
ncbi:HprK-related kinase A [Sphingomonas prati]|uniref:HprK-related kinase A n=1 Tax=Sphingomonas prati TaxID=1843237 RepID=A0A7W9F401_9SPHN|nr:HprK-related kinase A [Sphingomonas prati]MBB5730085.1 HprK-related kinase A [Sphingomonas prati]GGE91369.1 HPr kinase [Sphingomonas prati]